LIDEVSVLRQRRNSGDRLACCRARRFDSPPPSLPWLSETLHHVRDGRASLAAGGQDERHAFDFDVAKLRNGFQRALHKRPVPTEFVDQAVDRIVGQVLSLGEREIPSRLIGEMVMQELHKLDKVAYIRFASGLPRVPGRVRLP
jgi:hypothetical protein